MFECVKVFACLYANLVVMNGKRERRYITVDR